MWDLRDLSHPVALKKLDNNNLQAHIHYDPDCKVLYIINKGQSFVQFFYLHDVDGGEPHLQLIDQFKGDGIQQTVYFMPKRNVDFMNNELNRALRFNGKVAEYVTFKVPRKSGAFQTDLFPPCPSGNFSMSFDEWAGGENKPPILKEFDPNAVV